MRIKADTMTRNRDRITDALAMLPNNVLLEVERRAQYDAANDGFSTGGSGGGASSEVSRPTELTAIAIIEARQQADPQMTAFVILQRELALMRASAMRIERAMYVMRHIADGRRGRETSLHSCQACERSDLVDRPKSGYCTACYRAWLRTADNGQVRQDRLTFEIHRRAEDVVTTP